MSFAKGFEKTAGKLDMGKMKSIGSHFFKHRKDYLMGTAAVGSIGTAIGANKKKD